MPWNNFLEGEQNFQGKIPGPPGPVKIFGPRTTLEGDQNFQGRTKFPVTVPSLDIIIINDS